MLKMFRRLALILIIACAPALWSQEGYVLSGTLWTPSGVIEKGLVAIADGKITAIGPLGSLPARGKVISVDGVIFPGLVDLHNHLTWSVLPRWRLDAPVGNRYDWQALPQYVAQLSGPQASLVQNNLGCDMERYAEVKAMIGGATSVTGSFAPIPAEPNRNDCDRGLARNLDFASGLYSETINQEPLKYEVFPLQLSAKDAQSVRDGLASNQLRAFIIHVAEGVDASAGREFRMIKARGFLVAGVSIIHGVALGPSDFSDMAANHVGFVWSPRSNYELYGKTSDIRAAKAAGLTIALAPDWSPTGSSGLLQELQFAYHWNSWQTPRVFDDRELIQMATTNGAKLGGASDQIGSLAAGMRADLIVMPRNGTSAVSALLDSKPASVRLVMVGGNPLLGDSDLMRQLLPGRQFEEIDVCGQKKSLDIVRETQGELWQTIQTRLTAALQDLHSSLAPLAECN